MSLLPPEVHSNLAELLQNLSSPDNQARTLAEERLNNDWFIARPDVLLMGLVEQIQGSQEPSVRRPPDDAVKVERGLLTNIFTSTDAIVCSSHVS